MNQSLLHSQQEPALLMEINITPLIDVMLVLIIMLIITIPMQLQSMDLEIREQSAAVVQTDATVIQIRIDEDGSLSWNGERLADEASLDLLLHDLETELKRDTEIRIQVHAKVNYASFASVLANVQRRGLKKLSIVGLETFANP